ncbi:outer membrane component of multidrug efflux pump [Luminiphilus syltensis NOR5-1B]|uniref:Outer membrane component of multidrug efflux pump n=1 Tax=Luminiphilus syltensis NOR5-1B TaxID=565045 RepID=B8KV30_9GAMM|nr:outer membrane component of multidrug efflux pump [Luminiphilus syltensis NOR5-1B]
MLAQGAVTASDNYLRLEQVLDSAQQHFPKIMAALADRRAAEGDVTAALGAFDLVFDAEGFDRVDGFYDGQAIKGGAKQPLRPLGATVFSEYKLSNGEFPIYEDINYTNTGGTLAAGVLFSLLRDRDIDQRRFNEVDTRLALENADLDVLMVRIGVQQRAMVAYWQWVVAGARLRVYENLLRIALQREEGLKEQVARGARATIFLTENEQNILRRRSLVTSTRRTFEAAANKLAFYYRDDSSRLQIPTATQLPPTDLIAEYAEVDGGRSLEVLPEALSRRPEMLMLNNAIARADNTVALRENDLQARLDLRFEVNTPIGEIAEGGPSRDATDTVIGFSFEVPLERRVARGKLARSRAKRDALYYKQLQQQDQIEVEIRNIFTALDYADQLAALAKQEVELADLMTSAEQQRFKEGASDFFLVNVREETAANARVQYLVATLDTLIAQANFDAATLNLDALGLVDATP